MREPHPAGGIAQQAVDLVGDRCAARGHRRDFVTASHHREGQSAAEERPLDRPGECGFGGEDAVSEGERIAGTPFVHRACAVDRVDHHPQVRARDQFAEGREHLLGLGGVTHPPEEIGDAGRAPAHELALVEGAGIERGQHGLDLTDPTQPHQRAGEEIRRRERARGIERRACETFGQRGIAQSDRVVGRGLEQLGVDGPAAVQGEFGQTDPVGRAPLDARSQCLDELTADPAPGDPADTAAHDLTEEGVGVADAVIAVVVDDVDQSSSFRFLDRVVAGETAQDLEVERFAERQQLQGLQHLGREVVDAMFEE